ncbi:MAG: hypothetical protein ACLUNZ_00885 [Evtepia sp.]
MILVIGVNGVGKTTTIGKLANLLKNQGNRVLLAAGDTFRAAAADQLAIWAERGERGPRPPAARGRTPPPWCYDAMNAAKARDRPMWSWCDTAGRLHNKQNLMNELSKIRRVIDRELPAGATGSPPGAGRHHGQNGLHPGQAVLARARASPASS